MCWPVIPDSSAIHALKVNMATESCFKKYSLCKLQATQFLLSLQNKWLNCLVATDGKTAGPISCINVRRFACANFFKNECLVFLGENCICHIWFSREWKAGERKKFVPRGWATVKRKERGGSGAKRRNEVGIISHLPSWLLKTSGYIHDNQAVLDCAVSVDPDVSPITWEQRESKGEPTTACIDTNQRHS